MSRINIRPVLNFNVAPLPLQENTVNQTAVQIFGTTSLSDDQSSFPGARLRIDGLLAEDRLTIANTGSGASQLSFDGSNLRFGGTLVGTATGGQGSALEIVFNMDASTAAIQAVLNAVRYSNSSDTPTVSRQLTVDFHDGSPLTFAEFATSPFDPADIATFDVGNLSPVAVDADGDGDLDIVIGHSGLTNLRLFENTGSGFDLVNPSTVSTINTGYAGNRPTFADIDGDGDMDAFVYSQQGKYQYFENTGSSTNPTFVKRDGPTASQNPLNGFDNSQLGANSSITFADLDGDGDLDAIAGRTASNSPHLIYLENTGSADAPAFVLRAGTESPVSTLTLGTAGTNSPVLGDVDGDGDMDLVIAGNETIRYAENTGSATAPKFVLRTGSDNPFNGISSGPASRPALIDLDGDGDLDIVLSMAGPTLVAYANNNGRAATRIVDLTVAPQNDPNTAFDDHFTGSDTQSLAGNVLHDNGFGADSDRDGDTLTVSAVNGQAENVGVYITLAGGGRLKIAADGAMHFDPAGRYEHLPAGRSLTETVSYTIRDPGGATSTASVRISIDGLDNRDTVHGSPLSDVLKGGIADDLVYGGNGDDRLFGGTHNDQLHGGAGNDRLYGEAGNDLLRGGVGNDLLYGGDGSDKLLGDAGNDQLFGGAGIDQLYGGAGVDLLRGGISNDRLFGGDGADRLLGDAGNDQLFGGVGADRLYGGVGNDVLRGGASSDLLYGGTGADRMLGDAGNDQLFGGAGIDRLYGGAGNDLLRGGTGNDMLYGDTGTDRLFGDTGNDVLFGGAGVDRLYGGAGNDTLRGGAATDFLYGGAGTDRLFGDAGNDQLFGGAGRDYAYFTGASADYKVTQAGSRTIVSHKNGKGADGNDTLNGIEFLVFSDLTVAL